MDSVEKEKIGQLEKKERRKKMMWDPHVNQWREERQPGQFGPYGNTEVCEWTQEHQIRTKWHISSKEGIVMAYIRIDEL